MQAVIDLSQTDWSGKPHTLKGEWDFYWNNLLLPEDFETNSSLLTNSIKISLPGVWVTAKKNSQNLSGKGYATYRTKLILPAGLKMAAIQCPPLPSAYKIWADEVLIYKNGRVGSNSYTTTPGFESDVVYFPVHKPEIMLTLQIANFTYLKGGPKKEFYIGTEKTIKKIREFRILIESIPLGILILMSLYSLFQILLFRRKAIAFYFFLLFCLLITVYTLMTGETLSLFSDIPWQLSLRGTFFTFYLGTVFFILFFYRYNHFQLKRLHQTMLLLSGLGTIAALTAPADWVSPLRYYYYFLLLTELTIMFYKLMKKNPPEKPAWIAGLSFVMLALLHDAGLFLFSYVNYYWMSWGFIVFILIMPYLFARQNFQDSKHSENLLQELLILRDFREKFNREKQLLEKKELEILARRNEIKEKKQSFLKQFTEREKQIIDCLLEGLSYKEISSRLSISEKTVNSHLQNIYQKSEVKGRGAIIRLFTEMMKLDEINHF